MDQLAVARFDTVSRFDRVAQPASLAVPLPAGRLTDPSQLRLLQGDRQLPVQHHVTSRWPDGSCRWVLCHFLADLPGLAPGEVMVAIGSPAPVTGPVLTVEDTGDELTVETGPLRLAVSTAVGFPGVSSATLGGVVSPLLPTAVELELADGSLGRASGDPDWSVNELGPVRAVLQADGRLQGADGGLGCSYRGRLTCWAGQSTVEVELTVFQDTEADELLVRRLALPIAGEADQSARLLIGNGNYRTAVRRVPPGEAGQLIIDAEDLLYVGNEQVSEVMHNDVWIDWCGGTLGLQATLWQAYQQFPVGLTVSPAGLTVEWLPVTELTGPIGLLQGQAKTNRCQLRFHPADESEDDLVVASLGYQMPDQPVLPTETYTAAAVWPDTIFRQRVQSQIEGHLTRLGDHRCRAYGWLHWGDGPDWGYTQQGRGRGRVVWNNNEYDLPHVAYLHYALSGELRFRAAAEVAAQHWIDVDIVHYHRDPARIGGQVIHSARHTSGSISPCHEWVEGLLDYYHFTGRPEALAAAEGIADHVLGVWESSEHLRRPGASAARVTGWALRSLTAMFRETGQQRYLDPCHQIAENFLAWQAMYGGFLAPYHSHTLCRVPFMIAIACASLMRYQQITGDERISQLIVTEMDQVIATCQRPDGLFVYKDVPSLHRRGAGLYLLEALAYAYDLSGERRFLVAGLPTLLAELGSRGGGFAAGKQHLPEEQAVLFGAGQGPKEYASAWRPVATFYRALGEAGLLPPDQLDWVAERLANQDVSG